MALLVSSFQRGQPGLKGWFDLIAEMNHSEDTSVVLNVVFYREQSLFSPDRLPLSLSASLSDGDSLYSGNFSTVTIICLQSDGEVSDVRKSCYTDLGKDSVDCKHCGEYKHTDTDAEAHSCWGSV